jgi:N-acetylglucosamine-6-sulfatase
MFVFAGDNGYFWGEHGLTDKRLAYEEAIRMPLLVRYPKLIRPGTVIPQLVLNIDLAPTFLELAGAPIQASVEGTSVLPLFRKGSPKWRSAVLTEYFADPSGPEPRLVWQSVRTQEWKYIHYQRMEDADELYHLRDDPFEMKNRIGDAKCRRLLERMKAELAQQTQASIRARG